MTPGSPSSLAIKTAGTYLDRYPRKGIARHQKHFSMRGTPDTFTIGYLGLSSSTGGKSSEPRNRQAEDKHNIRGAGGGGGSKSNLFLLDNTEKDIVQHPHHGEGTSDDGKHRRQEVVPFTTTLLHVHRHWAEVVAELRLWNLSRRDTTKGQQTKQGR